MSRVIVIRQLVNNPDKGLDRKSYKIILEKGLRALVSEKTLKAGIKKLFPGGVVGMKTNCLARAFNSTSVALTAALSDILIDAGIKENNVVVWERSNDELKRAGFELNASSFGRRCLGTDSNGIGFSSNFYSAGEVNSLISRILTNIIDHNINLPVLKDHSIAGLSGGLKNMFGAINNPNKYHGNNCNPYAAHVSALEPIKAKNRLVIIDAVKVQYNAGPGYDSRYINHYGGLILSVDPVAADRVGLEILEHLRKINKLPSLKDAGRPADYLKTAEKTKLGIAEMQKIDLKVIMVDENGSERSGELW